LFFVSTGDYCLRWKFDHNDNVERIIISHNGFHEEEKAKDWNYCVYVAHRRKDEQMQKFYSLEAVHIFVLANILGRPIFVYTDGTTDLDKVNKIRYEGIYLPILRKHNECERSPIVLGFEDQQFFPLISSENINLNIWSNKATEVSLHCAPLVRYDFSNLPIRFLAPQEKPNQHQIMQIYLDLVKVPSFGSTENRDLTAAILKFKAPHAQSIELLWAMLGTAAAYAEEDKNNSSIDRFQNKPCIRQKAGLCRNVASINNNQNMCDNCYQQYFTNKISQNVKPRRAQFPPVKAPPSVPQPALRQGNRPIPNDGYEHLGLCLRCRIEPSIQQLDDLCRSCYRKKLLKKKQYTINQM